MTERQQLKALSRNEKQFLYRHLCGWCDQRLDANFCSAIRDGCNAQVRIERRVECLKSYKPENTND